MTVPMSREAYDKSLRDDYSVYVALLPIDIGGARAFNPGHAVPASHVASGLVDPSMVAKVGTKAAEKAADAIGVSLSPAPAV